MYVQYGCGLSAPEKWVNFDSSPTLRFQKLPFSGILTKRKVRFPDSVKYGDIVRGLPGIADNSCDGVYCSHVLEHLALKDMRIALKNTFKMLKKGGIFRCVLPDLEDAIKNYTADKVSNPEKASMNFMNTTLLGLTERPKGLKGLLVSFYGNAHHLWMWDHDSLKAEIIAAGFSSVRKCTFNDSADKHFLTAESEGRFNHAIALEAIK
jgi:Methyltransferase domain